MSSEVNLKKLNNKLRNAKQRGIDMDLSLDEFQSLINQERCIVTNSFFHGIATDPFRISIDRVDSNKGYTFDNTISMVSIANRYKKDLNTFDDIDKEIGDIKERNAKSDSEIARIDIVLTEIVGKVLLNNSAFPKIYDKLLKERCVNVQKTIARNEAICYLEKLKATFPEIKKNLKVNERKVNVNLIIRGIKGLLNIK